MLSRALLGFALLAAGCGVSADASSTPEKTKSTASAIVGGKVSTAAQDATVMLVMADELCTGTLIAPNLVLTARHCVAPPNEGSEECVAYGATVDPSGIQIYGGINANPDIHQNSSPVATGSKIFVPKTSNMCSFDVALVQLDRDVSGARIATVRFSELATNEPTIAVGYGVDENDKDMSQRMQRATTVIGVGPQPTKYTTKAGKNVTYNPPEGDVVTGESTCFGDSGGPLFDAQGQIVAITSRGIPQLFEGDTGHGGNGCLDEPSVFAGVRFHEQLIRQAAKAAGHELRPSTEVAPTTTGGAAGDDDDDDSTSGDVASDEDGEEKPKTRKKSANSDAAVAAAGCSSSPSGHTNGSWLTLVGAAVVLGVGRRRRRAF